MYCPNCGTETAPDRKFCRGCGMDLQPVAQLLTGQLPAQPLQNARGKAARYGFLTFLGGVLLAALLGTTGGAFMHLDPQLGLFISSLAGLGGLVVVVGLGLMVYSLFLPKAPAQTQPPQPQALPQAQPYAQLPPERFRQPVPSVIENTTELLDTPEEEPGPRNVKSQSE